MGCFSPHRSLEPLSSVQPRAGDKLVEPQKAQSIFMQQTRSIRQIYRFRLYSPAVLLVAIVLFLAIVLLPALLFDVKSFVNRYPEALVKGILIVFIIAFIASVHRLVTMPVEVRLDVNSIDFQYLRPGWFPFAAQDQQVWWNEIKTWKLTEEHFSLHSWSPAQFSLTMNDGRKINLMLADREQFQPFLLDFQRYVEAFNLKHTALPPIESGSSVRHQKRAAKFVLVLFAPLACYLFWVGLKELSAPPADVWETASTLGLGVLSLVLCGFMVRVLFKR